MKYYCNLRNFQDLMEEWKTPWNRNFQDLLENGKTAWNRDLVNLSKDNCSIWCANCINDLKDFQNAESVRSGNSHVTNQSIPFPSCKRC